jgi:hypothetical protein
MFMQMLIDAIGRKGINNIGWELLFEFETIYVNPRAVLLRENEIEDVVPSFEDALVKSHSLWEAKLIECPQVDLHVAVL